VTLVSGPGGRPAGRTVALVVVAALLASGCSGDDGGSGDSGIEVGVEPAGDASTEVGCDWPMWGHDPARTFAQTCESALSTATVDRLELDWSFTTEDVVTASVAVHDGTVYAGDWSGAVYALDDDTGEERWRFQTDVHDRVYSGQIVAGPAVAEVEGETALFVAGGKTMYRLDAATGEERWRFDVSFFDLDDDLATNDEVPDDERPTEIQSSPVVVDGKVVFGFDGHDIPGWRAGVVALDAVTGDVVWYFDPDGGGEPSGCAGVWSSPSVDVEAGRVFVGTANCPSSPDGWGQDTEAIVALDLDTGERLWSFQPHEPNNDDLDFAGAPNLFAIDGQAVVGLGNKDGAYYVVDRDTGDLVWEQLAEPSDYEPGRNFSFGGFIGPTAVLDGIVVGGTAGQGADACPCNHGLDAATGELRWQTREALPVYGGTAAVNDLAFNGGIDFLVRAVDLATGETLWSRDVPGVVAGAPAIVGDSVYAVVGLREPGTETTAEQAGVFKFSLGDEAAAGTTTSTPTETAYDGPVVMAPNDGRCVGSPCEFEFDFPNPPDGLTPTGTLLVTTDPFSFRLEAEGLGDPDQWVADNAPNAAAGAEVFVAALAVSVEQPFGAIICTFDADGVCEADTIPQLSASYERFAVLALPDAGAFPTVAEGAARLVYTATFDPPLVVVSPDPTE
jgi:outer membrane protein assembly factor BamB